MATPKYEVACIRADGELDHLIGFQTERDARKHINTNVDGVCTFRLYGPMPGWNGRFGLMFTTTTPVLVFD